MNLFILSLCFTECAQAMFDKHIYKMILEAVQMLSTAKRIMEPDAEGPMYKISHRNHPVSVWIRTSIENYMWTLKMVRAMHKEWQFRYGHTHRHKSYIVARWLKKNPPPLPSLGLTPFALAMPDQYKTDDPVESYRRYYQSPEKQRIASWKNREKPDWYQ